MVGIVCTKVCHLVCLHAAILESPLIRPIGHLLPRGGEGTCDSVISKMWNKTPVIPLS